MSVYFYEPFADFERLFDEAYNNHVGNQQVRRHPGSNAEAPGSSVARAIKPRMDLHENSENNTVTATFELPGLKKEDVQIDVHNNRLIVSAESKIEEDKNEDGWAIRERRYGKLSRTLQLPQGVKDSEIKASMENGVLTVTFPKSAPELAPKKIAVN